MEEVALQESTASLALRGGFLLVLVVLFQYFVARANVQKETKRRFQHALTGHALVQISYVLPRTISLILLTIGCIGMYLAKTFFFEKFLEAFGGLLRPKETSGEVLPGAFYFLVGTALVVSGLVTNEMNIARYAVECLALADPMASWVGSTIQSPKFTIATAGGGSRTSSLAGCLACFGTAIVVGWWMLEEDVTVLVAGAVACTVAEGLPFGNDNLNIPVITAFVVEQLSNTATR